LAVDEYVVLAVELALARGTRGDGNRHPERGIALDQAGRQRRLARARGRREHEQQPAAFDLPRVWARLTQCFAPARASDRSRLSDRGRRAWSPRRWPWSTACWPRD